MLKRSTLIALGGAAALAAVAANAGDNTAYDYRHAAMELIGHNFGPMAMMAGGDIPWDDARMAAYGKDLATLTTIDLLRGFPEGSLGGGETKAKPEIWKDFEDFKSKLDAFKTEAAKLGPIAASGDRKAIGEQIGATGKTCKGCHDKYKEKDED